MKLRKFAISSLSVLAAVSVAGFAAASSHREAPAISNDPAADNTDTYAWRCNQDGTPALCIVANYNPLELPEGGPNYNKFSDDVLYQLHITHNDANNKPNLRDFITVDVRFRTAPTPRVPVDPAGGVGGGKEFFAQLAGEFNQTATVSLRRNAGVEDGFVDDRDISRGEVLFSKKDVAPPNIGQRTSTFVYGEPNYAEFAKKFVFTNGKGYRFFAGPRDDAFYVNLAQIFDLGSIVGLNSLGGKPFRSRIYDVDPNEERPFANTDPTKAPDGVAGFNVHTIALAIPLTELAPQGREKAYLDALAAGTPSNTTLFGVWASASRRLNTFFCPPFLGDECGAEGKITSGPWRQVSRLGLPLICEAVIGVQDKDKFNRTTPANDVKNFGAYFLNPVLVPDVDAIGGYDQLGVETVPESLKTNRLDILRAINLDNIPSAGAHSVEIANGATGDVLRVDVAVASSFPNGRALSGPAVASGKEEDVTDVELSLILTGQVSGVTDYVGGPGDGRRLLTVFPYMAVPFAGDAEGKGSPAKF
jgi:hypothetical protein